MRLMGKNSCDLERGSFNELRYGEDWTKLHWLRIGLPLRWLPVAVPLLLTVPGLLAVTGLLLAIGGLLPVAGLLAISLLLSVPWWLTIARLLFACIHWRWRAILLLAVPLWVGLHRRNLSLWVSDHTRGCGHNHGSGLLLLTVVAHVDGTATHNDRDDDTYH